MMDGMIAAHDCVCDKFLDPRTPLPDEVRQVWTITMAPVHPLADLTGDRVAAVRADRMPRYFYLPAEGDRPELVADLYLEQPVRFLRVLEGDRLTSLSAEWIARLWTQFMRLRLGEDYMQFVRRLVEDAG